MVLEKQKRRMSVSDVRVFYNTITRKDKTIDLPNCAVLAYHKTYDASTRV